MDNTNRRLALTVALAMLAPLAAVRSAVATEEAPLEPSPPPADQGPAQAGPGGPAASGEATLGAEAPPASATDEKSHASWERPMPGLVVGARLGCLFGQPFSALGTAVIPELSVAYHPDWWMRRLGVVFALSYSRPQSESTHVDPRMTENGGLMIYRHTLHDFAMSLAPTLWLPIGPLLIPYASAGMKLHLYRNDAEGSTGAQTQFGENQEPKTRVGFVGRLGLGVKLGPGAATIDLTLDAAPVNEVTTGDANAGDLIIAAGYSLFL